METLRKNAVLLLLAVHAGVMMILSQLSGREYNQADNIFLYGLIAVTLIADLLLSLWQLGVFKKKQAQDERSGKAAVIYLAEKGIVGAVGYFLLVLIYVLMTVPGGVAYSGGYVWLQCGAAMMISAAISLPVGLIMHSAKK